MRHLSHGNTSRLFFLLATCLSLVTSSAFADETRYFNLGCSSGECNAQPWEQPVEPPPFLRNGMKIEDERQSFSFFEKRNYSQALKKFPDAQDCLSPEADTQQGVDLTKVIWSNWKSKIETEVCIARIVNRIGSVPKTLVWLEAIDFRVVEIVNGTGFYGKTSILSPNWVGEGKTPLAWGRFIAHPHSLDMRLESESGKVLSVSIIYNL